MSAVGEGSVRHRIAFVVGRYPGKEQARREDVLASYSDAGTEVGILRVEVSPYSGGLSSDRVARLVPHYLDAFAEAERQGYDAVIPFGMYDLGVDGGKSQCRIPVVGPCEAALHLGALVGERFGMVAYSGDLVPTLRRLVRSYDMHRRVVSFRHLDIDLSAMGSEEDEVVRRFEARCAQMVEEDGADTIIPMGVTQCPVMVGPVDLSQRLGVPVVDGVTAPLQMAKALIESGQGVSRRAWPYSGGDPRADR